MSVPHDDRKRVPLSDAVIDRLVDGELDDSARRALLGRLDAESDGWRRCALAFLEAQAWREAVSTIAPEELAAGPIGPRSVVPPAARLGRFRGIGRRISLAAAVLSAFACGWLASTATRGSAPARRESPALVQAPPSPDNEAGPPSAAVAEDRARPALATNPTSLDAPAAPGDGGLVDLGFSEPIRRHLEQNGYRLEHRRSLMSMDLNNGRTVAVPVDAVEVRYVGHQVY